MFFCVFQFSDTRRKYNFLSFLTLVCSPDIFIHDDHAQCLNSAHFPHTHTVCMYIMNGEKDCTYTHDDDNDKIKTNFTA